MRFLNSLSKIFRIIFTVFLVYFIVRLLIYHYQLIIFPYSSTFREAALQSTTSLLLHGINPYAVNLQPQYTNIYGIVYPLITWPFANLWGQTLLVHRAVTAFFVFACCLCMFFVLFKKKVPLLLNISAVVMLYASLLYPGTSTPCVDPAAMGLFFMLLTIFIPYFMEYSRKSLVMSIVCGIIAFYTKLYLVLGLPIMAFYLFLFVSKKKAVFYSGALCVLFVLSVVVMNKVFPLYFDNCFFTHSNYAAEWSSNERLQSQLKTYFQLHLGVVMLMLGVFIYTVMRVIKSTKWQALNIRILDFLKRLSLNFEAPLIKVKFPIDIFAGICTLLVLVLLLGKHRGATLWYFFQLFSPFFLMGVAQIICLINLWSLIALPFLIFNLYSLTVEHKLDKQMEGWSHISSLINSKNEILCSPIIAPLLIEQNREIFDNGQSEYFLYGGQRKGFWRSFLKDDQRSRMAMAIYLSKLRQMIQHKEFDLLIMSGSAPSVKEDIMKYYKYMGDFSVYAPQDRRSYMLSIWVPS